MKTNSLPESRLQLQDTLTALEAARTASQAAEKIVADAEAAVGQCIAAVGVFEDLDSQIAKARLSVLKGADSRALEETREAQRQRLLAKEELIAAEATWRLAEEEAAKAAEVVAEAETARDTAVVTDISEYVEQIASAIEEVNRKRERLRDMLRALQVLSPGWEVLRMEQVKTLMRRALSDAGIPSVAPMTWAPLQYRIANLLADKGVPIGLNDVSGIRAEWARFVTSLIEDPAAAEALPLPE